MCVSNLFYIKDNLPVKYKDLSPHLEFEHSKPYKDPQCRKLVNEAYDAFFDVVTISSQMESALRPMGCNYHFYPYMAVFYGKLFKALVGFERANKAMSKYLGNAPVNLRDYYAELNFPPSSAVYSCMKSDLEWLSGQVGQELEESKANIPNWNNWDDNFIDWDIVNQEYKKASK